jgi:hypothetical protein
MPNLFDKVKECLNHPDSNYCAFNKDTSGKNIVEFDLRDISVLLQPESTEYKALVNFSKSCLAIKL